MSTHFQKIVIEQGFPPENINYFDCTTPFLLRIKASKMLIFEVFLHLKEPLLATFNERSAITFKKYIAEQGINILKVSQKHKLFRSFLSVFALIASRMLFLRFFVLKRRCWPLSMKCVHLLPENM